MALLTILCCMLLLIPTLTVLHLFLRRLRPIVEFVALVPFVIPRVSAGVWVFAGLCAPTLVDYQ
jgi:ABC-type spermidine/putrescine transport system permease subunit II